MKLGPKGGMVSFLSQDQLQRLHEAALALLGNPGIHCESDLLLDVFARGGAHVDREARTVRIPADLVEWAIRSAPSSFVLYARDDPANDLLLEEGRVYYGMGGTSEPGFFDWDLWARRAPTKADMISSTRIGHACENIDFVQTLCMSGDMPSDHVFFHDYDAIFRNTTKPTVLSILERPFTRKLLALAAAASGGQQALRDRPSVIAFVSPVSPLKIGAINEGVVDAVEAGVPVMYSPGPMMGATGPATIAGTIALTTAESLAGVVLVQLLKPGAPMVLKPDTDVFDMRTSQCTYGSPEQNLGKLAMAQLARRYQIPIYSLGGGVEAKVPDADAASESMMSMLLNALAGINLNQSLGSMAFGLYGCQEQVVICDEQVRQIKHILRGITVDEDTLALDVTREVGYGGSYLGHEHTGRWFRQELYFPRLFVRQTIEEWEASGKKMAHDVAHERVRAILEKAGPVPLSPAVDAALEQALRDAIRS